MIDISFVECTGDLKLSLLLVVSGSVTKVNRNQDIYKILTNKRFSSSDNIYLGYLVEMFFSYFVRARSQ